MRCGGFAFGIARLPSEVRAQALSHARVLICKAEAWPRRSAFEDKASQKAKTREAGSFAGFILLFVVGAKGFEPSTL
jgi:hypothetical protein